MKKLIILALTAMLLLAVSGCTFFANNEDVPPPQNGDRLPEPDPNMRETVFYLPDENWQVLIPVRTQVPWEEGIARATVGYLTEGRVPQELLQAGMAPLLPAGTEILGLSIRDGLARIDFSESFLRFDSSRERMVIYGLVYTLTEFPTINKVEILVEGKKPDVGSGLSSQEPFDRSAGINLEVAESATDFEQAERITLYYLYPLGERAYYVPVTRVVNRADDMIRLTAEELNKGPAAGSPLFTALPQGAAFEGVRVEGVRLTLNYSGDFTVTGGQRAADRLQGQLALTFTEIPGVMEVEVLLDGDVPEFPAGVRIPETFDRPRQWNPAGGH